MMPVLFISALPLYDDGIRNAYPAEYMENKCCFPSRRVYLTGLRALPVSRKLIMFSDAIFAIAALVSDDALPI